LCRNEIKDELVVEQGYADAQCNLGFCYDNGTGVVKNEKKAFEWYEKAAEQGLEIAQNNLGSCYKKGTGVLKNEKKAIKWFEKAAEQGLADAQNQLRLLKK
jgi:TPR repeat protein